MSFERCYFTSSYAYPDAVHAGFKPLINGNTKNFRFAGCHFSYCAYGSDLTLTSGSVSYENCRSVLLTQAFLMAGQGSIITLLSCEGEGDNSIIDTPGAGFAIGTVLLDNCEWHVRAINANAMGHYHHAVEFYGGRLDVRGGFYEHQIRPTVTGATAATPIVITTDDPNSPGNPSWDHNLITGDRVEIRNVGGVSAANGFFRVTRVSATQLSLQNEETGSNVAGAGSYTSGGEVTPALKWTTLSHISYPGANPRTTLTGVALYGSGMYPSVVDSSNNYLFDSTYAASLTTSANPAVALECCSVSADGSLTTTRMPDIGYLTQVAIDGDRQVRRPILDIVDATYEDDPTNQKGILYVGVLKGAGSPEGAVTATVGTLYRRTDGGANTSLYSKVSGSGNTGWQAVPTLDTTALTRVVRGYPLFVTTEYSCDRNFQLTTLIATAAVAVWPIEIPDGSTLDSITVKVIGAGAHGGLPGTMPGVKFRKYNISTASGTVSSATLDGSGSVGAFEAAHEIVKSSIAEVINNETTRYGVQFESEDGANALAGLIVLGVTVTFTPATPDGGAA